MPSAGEKVTDSWSTYQDCTRSIQHFLNEIRVKDAEVWLGDVCLGSPDHPFVRAPLQIDSAELVDHSVGRAHALVAAVTESLQSAVKTSRRVMEELGRAGVVDSADLAAVVARTDSLEKLLAELTSAATFSPIKCHPAILIRWREILGPSLVPGDPAVQVRVVTVYVL